MKKILLLLLTVSLFSCSGDDSNETTNSNNHFNPPIWVQGTWGIESALGNQQFFRFKPNDFCTLLNNGQSETCWNAQVDFLAQHNVNHTAEEIATDTDYTVSFGSNGSTITYHFQKISATKIRWINGSTNPELTKIE